MTTYRRRQEHQLRGAADQLVELTPGPAGGVSSLALAQGSPKASPIVPRFRRSRGLPYPSSSARERNNLAFSSGDSSGITAKGRLEEI
jgi:hypothetical protein